MSSLGSISAILFGTALFISLANIAFDVYLQVEGCCSLYPDACTWQEKFDIAQSSIESTSDLIDAKWGLAQNLLTYVQYSSTGNQAIALELKRITQSYENIIETIDPEILNHYNNMSEALKKEVEEKNSTVLAWTNADIDTAFVSLFDTSIGRVQILSGLMGLVAEGTLTYVWNWYKTAKIKTTLRTNYGTKLTSVHYSKANKVLGNVDLDNFINDAAVAKRNADVSTSRGAKAMSWASRVLILVQIGLDIWMAVLKVKQCKQVRDKVKKAYEQIEPEEKDMQKLYADITEHYANMSSAYTTIKTQISDESFLGYLESIKNLTDSSSTQSSTSAAASETITRYINTIAATTDYNAIWVLQGDLITALGSITFTLDCYHKKVQAYSVVASRCKSGDDTLQNIYNTVIAEFDTNDDACAVNASLTYTTYDDVKIYSDAQALANSYNADCLLNDAVKQDAVCSKACSGKKDATIATDLDITAEYLTTFKALCPPSCPLTPAQVIQLCMLKGYGLKLAQIQATFPHNDQSDVEAAYYSCS